MGTAGVGEAGAMTAAAREVVINVSGLRMSYDGFDAVRGIDLQVRRSEVFAFLGPNGAGKTTTVEIMEGYRRRTGGGVTVLGEDPDHGGASWRARIGVVLQESEPERDLTASECLRLFAGYFPESRDVGETLKLVGLAGRANATASRLSGGQRRRLDVAMALIGNPELVFLDEPTTGFDPSARRAAWEMISGLRSTGVTVFLTTHYMDEAGRASCEALDDLVVRDGPLAVDDVVEIARREARLLPQLAVGRAGLRHESADRGTEGLGTEPTATRHGTALYSHA
jgi:ABC-2 type transport system ATP-binding protein